MATDQDIVFLTQRVRKLESQNQALRRGLRYAIKALASGGTTVTRDQLSTILNTLTQ